MYVYHFDGTTLEFTGRSEARIDPLETERAGEPRYLVPALASTESPPEFGEHETAVFDPSAGSWYLAPDFRGAVHYDPETGRRLEIETPGVLPEVTVPPPTNLLKPRWSGWEWVEGSSAEETAAAAKQAILAELAATDAAMGRVVEDLIEVLAAKGTITMEELPQAAREKIAKRKLIRSGV